MLAEPHLLYMQLVRMRCSTKRGGAQSCTTLAAKPPPFQACADNGCNSSSRRVGKIRNERRDSLLHQVSFCKSKRNCDDRVCSCLGSHRDGTTQWEHPALSSLLSGGFGKLAQQVFSFPCNRITSYFPYPTSLYRGNQPLQVRSLQDCNEAQRNTKRDSV